MTAIPGRVDSLHDLCGYARPTGLRADLQVAVNRVARDDDGMSDLQLVIVVDDRVGVGSLASVLRLCDDPGISICRVFVGFDRDGALDVRPLFLPVSGLSITTPEPVMQLRLRLGDLWCVPDPLNEYFQVISSGTREQMASELERQVRAGHRVVGDVIYLEYEPDAPVGALWYALDAIDRAQADQLPDDRKLVTLSLDDAYPISSAYTGPSPIGLAVGTDVRATFRIAGSGRLVSLPPPLPGTGILRPSTLAPRLFVQPLDDNE